MANTSAAVLTILISKDVNKCLWIKWAGVSLLCPCATMAH
jgi:hypothetical protein